MDEVLLNVIVLIVVAFLAILAEFLFPSVRVESTVTIVYASRAFIVACALTSLLFLFTSAYAMRVSIREFRLSSRKHKLLRKPFIRDILLEALILFIAIFFGFGAFYLSAKSLTVTDKGMQLNTLFETEEILWTEGKIKSYAFDRQGNDITLLNPTYVDFVTKQGEVVHFNLQYMDEEPIKRVVQRQIINQNRPENLPL